MQIAVIGTGNVGRAVGGVWARAGHQVTYGTRDPAKLLGEEPGARVLTPEAAADGAEVVLLALPWKVAEAAIAGLGPLTGTIVIDCMNPIAMGPEGMGLAIGHTTSGGELVQSWLPDARVVKTLNQVGAEIMAHTTGFPVPPVQLLAGNDAAAKGVVAGLLTDLGFEPLDAGLLSKSRLLEPFALVWINQAIARGHGRDWAFGAMRKSTGEKA